MSDTEGDQAETVTYQFDIEKEIWRPWSNTVPRQTALDARLKTIIEQDLRASQRDANSSSEVSAKTISIMASRIRIRAMNAMESIRDGDETDTESAIEQLEEITDIADAMEF